MNLTLTLSNGIKVSGYYLPPGEEVVVIEGDSIRHYSPPMRWEAVTFTFPKGYPTSCLRGEFDKSNYVDWHTFLEDVFFFDIIKALDRHMKQQEGAKNAQP